MAHLVVDEPRTTVRRLTLNRPEKRNALSRALVAELCSQLRRAAADDVRVVVIRGSGSSFCAGADLEEHFTEGGDSPPDIGRSELWGLLETLPVPVIAAVHGHAVTGGFLLAYCCDLIVAAEDAVFRDTHATLGLIPTGGETQRLPRRIGVGLARELLLTSRPLPADEAQLVGLVNRVVPAEELDAAALHLAEQVAAQSPRSIRAIKEMVNIGMRSNAAVGLALEQQVNGFGSANDDEDGERRRRLQLRRGRSDTT